MSEEEVQQAKALLLADRVQREEDCKRELANVLARYRCTLLMIPGSIDATTIEIRPTIRAEA